MGKDATMAYFKVQS